jgi:hypothetical protein
MASPQQMITGELRKWHHDVIDGQRVIVGYMYNDRNDIWDDGDIAILHYRDLYESANFYIAFMNLSICIKCPKDEEVTDASKKFNGSGDVNKT